MHPLEVTHWTLVQKRTRIRHDKRVQLWIQRCWTAVQSTGSLDRAAFDVLYKKLLEAMTIDWDDDMFDAITELMWRRDATPFATLDNARFSCSLFAFAEMWVEALDIADYVRVFHAIDRILLSASNETIINCSNPTTLAAFLDALRRDAELVAMHISIGKSTVFSLDQYAQTFGTTLPDALSSVVPRSHRSASGTHHRRSHAAVQSLPKPLRPRTHSALIRIDTSRQLLVSSTAMGPVVTRSVAICRPKSKVPMTPQLNTP